MSEAPPPGRDRQAARTFGIRAEWAALALLTLTGYRVLARNFTAPGGEIDLIAQRGQTVAFIEVKARPDMDQALIAITEQKRRRIARAAQDLDDAGAGTARHGPCRSRWQCVDSAFNDR